MTFEKGKLFFDFEQRINFEVAPYFFLKITIMEIRKEKKRKSICLIIYPEKSKYFEILFSGSFLLICEEILINSSWFGNYSIQKLKYEILGICMN